MQGSFLIHKERNFCMMCNKEGYSDKTAEMAISRVYKEEMVKKKGGVKKYGYKGLSSTKKSKKAGQY